MKSILISILLFSVSLFFNEPVYANDYSFSKFIPIDTLKEATNEAPVKNTAAKRRGDNLYFDQGYLSSADYYLKLHKKGKLGKNGMLKLAESYRLNSKTHDAEYWYAQATDEDSDPEQILHYAQVLQSNGKCEDATRWYQIYLENTEDVDRALMQDCNDLENLPEYTGVKIINQASINSSNSDFSPIMFKEGIVFTSTRGYSRPTKNLDKWTKENFTDLFYVEQKGTDNFGEAVPFTNVNGRFHDGTATFDDKKEHMIFTRNSSNGKSEEGIKTLKLYESNYENDRWAEAKPLSINNDNYSDAHPCLSADGSRLYFASDRPGGFGGMDIYVSNKVSGEWLPPVNLGPIVNSAGNEVFPFIDIYEKLYYASDGHFGFGGLDIFMAQKSIKYDDASWDLRENMGAPFNSPQDDFGFMAFAEGNMGYLSSNRIGGKGEDDIYKWKMADDELIKAKKSPNKRSICVDDLTNGQKLAGMQVKVAKDGDADGEMTLTLKPTGQGEDEYLLNLKDSKRSFITNDKGFFYMNVVPNANYTFTVSGNDYKTKSFTVSSKNLLTQREYCLSLEPQICITLHGQVNNKTFQGTVPNVKIELFNKCNGEITETYSDDDGSFNFCLDCNCEYELTASKDYFDGDPVNITTIGMSCNEPDLLETQIDLNLLDKEAWEEKQAYQNRLKRDPFAPENNHALRYDYPKEFLLEYLTGNPNTVLQSGQVFVLRNIYYDFAQFDIRLDAENELDYVVALMEQHPDMKIALEAHTDARGTDDYNNWLSNQRAKAAYEYLIARGVRSSNIVKTTGFGEENPINDCRDSNPCSEAAHQLNRRTEVRIISI